MFLQMEVNKQLLIEFVKICDGFKKALWKQFLFFR